MLKIGCYFDLVNGKPERRENKTVYVSGNVEVGDVSDEVEAICRP